MSSEKTFRGLPLIEGTDPEKILREEGRVLLAEYGQGGYRCVEPEKGLGPGAWFARGCDYDAAGFACSWGDPIPLPEDA